MSNIILQPSGNKDAREHFNDTIELPVKLSKIENLEFRKFLKLII